MREIYCRHCGRYLLSVEADAGRLAITCRSCKRRQTVDLGRDGRAADVGQSRERETVREREAVECRN